eukprot:CAMPEP_0114360304 /NCGR_PEP_ID=MMETSP0101-20121206/23746_1 /TAXON_ID=38822 ORGANISM="Pteridomonas danica, Strain PT" /NCGR_SAMPLE_ID=MMETSP0101 /ASSEMBLY_ACC=CAM_ASM_000211 /LENGTH=107 /DNA_ID=CAMNT_0001504439 /DNA_START=165 /DNA_END=485 /DNA_ORIENTATION=+
MTSTNEVDESNKWGVRALAYACSYNRMHCVKALVAAGANPRGDSRCSPLSWSCGHANVAKFLIKCGVCVSDEISSGNIPILERAQKERSRGKTYVAWADVLKKTSRA